MRKLAVIAVLALCLVLAGCSTGQVITNLELVTDGVGALLPAIAGATGLSAPTVASIQTYLNQVNNAAEAAANILASTQPPAVKAATISSAFAGIVAPDLPAGTPQTIVSLVQTVAQAVVKFLASTSPAVAAKAPKNLTVPAKDIARLSAIRAKATDQRARIATLKAK